ncbi:MAG TPA: hypothetical protein VHD60_02690 [Candidatus Saccharimonadales bacterium]|nr:hypothetical protein [Candidatus Saccharimonadales bacterium]
MGKLQDQILEAAVRQAFRLVVGVNQRVALPVRQAAQEPGKAPELQPVVLPARAVHYLVLVEFAVAWGLVRLVA